MTSPDHRPPANNPPNPRNKPMTYHILNVPLRVLGVVVGLGLSGVGWGQDACELTAGDDVGTIDANNTLPVNAAAGLLANDNDTCSGTLTIDKVGPDAASLADAGTDANVGVEIRGSHNGLFTVMADGSYTFDPNNDFDDIAVGSTQTTSIHYRVASPTTTLRPTAELVVTVTGAITPLPTVTITPTTLTVPEGGSGAYSVVLDAAPEVTVLSYSMGPRLNTASFAPTVLTFTTANGNWNTAQTFTVTLLPGAADGDTLTLNHRMRRVGEEPDAGVDRGAVMVMVTAAVMPGVTISETTVEIPEGATDTYTVALTTAPSGGNVTVTPMSDNTDVAVSGALTFTASNYNTPQMVVVTGVDDMDTDDDTATITHTVAGADYGSVPAADVTVTVTDDDRPGVTISETNVGITEGASGFYTVALATVPSVGEVTVTPGSADAGAVSVTAALVFDADNWNRLQTVTVGGVMDDDTVNESVVIANLVTVSDSSSDYDTVTAAGVTVTVTDNDTPAPAPTTPATAEDAVNRIILPDVTREMSDRQMGAIARRMGQARSGDGGGEYSSAAFSASAAAWAAEAMRSGVDGGFDGKAMLGASDFVLPLGASGGGGALGESAAMWGNGDFSQLGGETRKIDWDGDLLSVNAGVDAHLGDELLGGVMLSWNEADIGYTDDTTDRERGDYDLDMFSIHPYIGNSTPDGRLDWWATLGFGNGDLVIRNKTNNTRSTSDVSMHMVGIGGNNRLHVRGDNELRLKAEAFATGADVKGGKAADMVRLSALDVNTQRMRVALQARRPHTLPGGANLTLEVEGGMRYDGGDGETGSGVEVGSAVRYADAARGLTWGVHTRALLFHAGDYEDFGIGGDVQLNAGADGQGLSLSLAPAYGNTGGGGVDEVWQGGLPVVDADADLQASLNTRVGYGLPSAAFMLTPYGEMALGEEVQNYRLGLSWGVGRLFDLNLVGERAEKDGVGAEHAVWFEGRVWF